MISQTAEYALRAVVYLADHGGDPKTNVQIAEATQVPTGYLAKVMQGLSRARVVNSQRGLNGGFTLKESPDELTVLAVINAIDPIRRIHECPLGLPSHGTTLCPLHQRIDNAAALVEEAFGDTTISELLDVPKSRKPLCRFPIAKGE
ncbi:MAG: Rrf2 family transcriptional regulator [Planctomycetaceae bacterium]|nr:Rrf2 family transcriptional regulator [Planctomycetales bacterium]MCB9873544.1 Rrf2 family transcriptional regulator [Planctomycetaceae bacterium]MCB9937110.1 Rrf2 family transcriptional regulator [Planctomycetaceae bacterium]HRX78194.1 Rrf2 family transcriptional regulator [Pirellulaceae bacterium]